MIKVFVQKTMAKADIDTPLTSGSVGLEVEFVFSEDWSGLTKTAVFETSSFYKETAPLSTASTIVPADVMAWEDETLYIGVYGTAQNGEIVIPTVYANCGRIHKGANDSEGGRPLIPAQSDILQNQIDSLGGRVAWLEATGGGGGGAGILLDTTLTQSGAAADAKAVGDALAELEDKIPEGGGSADLTGYATEEWVKAGYQPKGDYLTEVPAGYAKTEDIPAKPEDIGAQPAGSYLTEVPAGYATEEYVRNKIAEAELGGEEVDLSGYAQKSELPTKVSQLENDKGYLTEHQDISGKLDASALPSAVNTALAQAKASGEFDGKDGQDGSPGKDGVSATHSWNGTTLTITSASGTSSANLKGDKGDKGDTGGTGAAGTSVTVKSVSESTADGGSNVVTFSDGKTLTIKNGSKGSTGAAGKDGSPGAPGADGADGYTPVRGKDYYTEADKAEFSNYIATELAKRGQLQPEYADSIENCTDTTKLYVLPDGFIYAWMLTEKEVESGPAYTNLLPLAKNTDRTTIYNGKGYKENTKLSGSSGGESTAGTGKEAMCSSGFIFPVAAGEKLRIKGISPVSASNHYVVGYDASNARTGNDAINFAANDSGGLRWSTGSSSGKYTFENEDENNPKNTTIVYTINTAKLGANVNAVRICAAMDENTIVTLNEEIKEGGGTTIVKEWAWASTGHAFVPADYEDRIVALEEETAQNTADISALKKGSATATPIKTWDAPIYDANIPVFQLSAEKAAITSAEKTVSAVYAKYDALMARHPNYITKTNLGMCSDGVTPVYRYDFREPEPHRGVTGAKEWSETKAKAIIVSGIHWEWGGIFALYNALEELADNPALFHLRRNTHLIVLPVCNPYAVANMSVRNANQVEIHRNFEVDFIYPGEPGYIEIGERSHGGTAPLSEVETQYIDNIFKANTDAAFFLTCHSNQSDSVYGTGFTWASPATYYMCNMHYRLVDKLSEVWMDKYGDELAAGIADYRTENTPEWDNRLGSAYLSTTNGTETKQATKYGIQATNIEVTDAFLVHGTKASPEPALSSFTMSRGAEVYVNFLLTAFGVYDPKDKALYG